MTHPHELTLTTPELVLLIDALDVLSPDDEDAERRRQRLLVELRQSLNDDKRADVLEDMYDRALQDWTLVRDLVEAHVARMTPAEVKQAYHDAQLGDDTSEED